MSALTGDSLHLVEVPLRWRVYRLRGVKLRPWVAQASSVVYTAEFFQSWREAFDYADRMSR